MWSIQQEDFIRVLRQERKIQSWKIISNLFNRQFPNKIKTGKQCRERYTNYVKFRNVGTQITYWTQEQELYLFKSFFEFGPRWSKIAQEMGNKSENTVKNRFYGIMRKLLRRIAQAQRFYKIKSKKPIKLELLIKSLQTYRQTFNQSHDQQKTKNKFHELVISIKQKIIDLIERRNMYISLQQIKSLIDLLHQFILHKKFFGNQKLQCQSTFEQDSNGSSLILNKQSKMINNKIQGQTGNLQNQGNEVHVDDGQSVNCIGLKDYNQIQLEYCNQNIQNIFLDDSLCFGAQPGLNIELI